MSERSQWAAKKGGFSGEKKAVVPGYEVQIPAVPKKMGGGLPGSPGTCNCSGEKGKKTGSFKGVVIVALWGDVGKDFGQSQLWGGGGKGAPASIKKSHKAYPEKKGKSKPLNLQKGGRESRPNPKKRGKRGRNREPKTIMIPIKAQGEKKKRTTPVTKKGRERSSSHEGRKGGAHLQPPFPKEVMQNSPKKKRRSAVGRKRSSNFPSACEGGMKREKSAKQKEKEREKNNNGGRERFPL